MNPESQTILVICGPTASGKTSLALAIASHLHRCAIFSADSRQTYKDLSILTGKDIPENLPQGTKIYGTDFLEADENISIAVFVKKTLPLIEHNLSQKIPVIIVGGSGLYLKALTSNLSDINIPPDPKLREELASLSVSDLQDKLRGIDQALFNRLNHSDQNNPRRLVRHIEKILSVGEPSPAPSLSANFHWIGLSLSPATQKKLIEKRVNDRVGNGAIDEVSKLIFRLGGDKAFSLSTSLGFKEIADYLDGEINNKEMVDSWVKSELDYARAQMVWFKKQPGIIWYDETTDKDALAVKLASKLQTK